jgi:hypothetical protein
MDMKDLKLVSFVQFIGFLCVVLVKYDIVKSLILSWKTQDELA